MILRFIKSIFVTLSTMYRRDQRIDLNVDLNPAVDLNPDELCYYPYMISLGRSNGSYNALNDQSDRLFAPNKKGFYCKSI